MIKVSKAELNKYAKDVVDLYKRGVRREHGYRNILHNFLKEILPKEYEIIEEPSFIYVEPTTKEENNEGTQRAAPDFAIKHKGLIIGYLETKSLDVSNMSNIEETEQIKTYLSITKNLIITNYLKFIYFGNTNLFSKATTSKPLTGSDTISASIRGANTTQTKEKIIKAEVLLSLKEFYHPEEITPEKLAKFNEIFNRFIQSAPPKIGTTNQLAQELAVRASLLKQYLSEELNLQRKEERDELYGLYVSLRNNLSNELDAEEFADTFAQVIAYSLFLAKLNTPSGELLNIYNVEQYVSGSFNLIAEMIKFLKVLANPKKPIAHKCAWLLEELFNIINNIDSYSVGESLSFRNPKVQDPYLYFYEDFLLQYDKTVKINRGVFYTPPEAVKYIVESVNIILKRDFNLVEGLADTKVSTLDFATGTGTFLLKVFREILENLPQNSSFKEGLIKEHLLKNIYGFEYLIAPYAVAHLKLSEYLKEEGYQMSPHERLQIYLTNTLTTLTPQADLFMPELSSEGEEACRIKEAQPIMVVLGNPPYNASSQNPSKDKKGKLTFIGELMQSYKPVDEQNIQPLDDDYLKFIRFAQHKLEQQKQGIIAIIVNNSFIDGLTHRKMRTSLMADFSKIYVLNLHGDSNKKEKTPEGDIDQNIFNIKQGVAILILVKGINNWYSRLDGGVTGIIAEGVDTGGRAETRVYYQDIWGRRAEKKHYLNLNNISTTEWEELDIANFNQNFQQTNWGKSRFTDPLSFFKPIQQENLVSYGEGVSVTEMFQHYISGINSLNDNIAIQYNKSELEDLITDFKKGDLSRLTAKYNIKADTRDWHLDKAILALDQEEKIEKVCYRPFDDRYTYYHKHVKGFLSYPRYKVMQHFLIPNIGISFIRHSSGITSYTNSLVHNTILDKCTIGGTSYTAPLYLTEVTTRKVRRSGTKKEIYDRVISGDNLQTTFKEYLFKLYQQHYQPQEILGYIYAVLYSNLYREKYLEYLKIDFPRVIFFKDKPLFEELSKLGQKLIDAHLLEEVKPHTDYQHSQPIGIDLAVTSVSYNQKEQKLYINAHTYFNNITLRVYNYEIAGKVLERYLKARKGRTLSNTELQHLQKVISTLTLTITLQSKIDNILSALI